MEEYIELKLLGITYNQIESGVYALILEEPISKKRLPIVIGFPEAQSIECKLQNIKTPRPLSHDMMAAIIEGLEAKLEGIYIHRLPTGVYAANLKLIDSIGFPVNIDSRSSDAVALAIRMGAPIYTTRSLLERSGFTPDKAPAVGKPDVKARMSSAKTIKNENEDLSRFSTDELREKLLLAVAQEKYELAANIKLELEKREKGTSE